MTCGLHSCCVSGGVASVHGKAAESERQTLTTSSRTTETGRSSRTAAIYKACVTAATAQRPWPKAGLKARPDDAERRKAWTGAGRIAQTLNAQGVPPPSAYRAVSAGQPRPTPAPLWCKATVRRILSTQTYAGDLEQGRVRKLNYKSRRVIRLPREDWIIVPGTHVPLISRADFAAVQARLAAHGGQTAAARHPLAGLVRCGVCGGKMELTGTAARRYFRCRTACRSKTACPGQPYWPLCDAEALVENQLSRYAAAPGKLTQDQATALLQSITVYPPQDGTRRIELRWSF